MTKLGEARLADIRRDVNEALAAMKRRYPTGSVFLVALLYLSAFGCHRFSLSPGIPWMTKWDSLSLRVLRTLMRWCVLACVYSCAAFTRFVSNCRLRTCTQAEQSSTFRKRLRAVDAEIAKLSARYTQIRALAVRVFGVQCSSCACWESSHAIVRAVVEAGGSPAMGVREHTSLGKITVFDTVSQGVLRCVAFP